MKKVDVNISVSSERGSQEFNAATFEETTNIDSIITFNAVPNSNHMLPEIENQGDITKLKLSMVAKVNKMVGKE